MQLEINTTKEEIKGLKHRVQVLKLYQLSPEEEVRSRSNVTEIDSLLVQIAISQP